MAANNEDAQGARRVALIILDGWGYAPPGPGNAVALADTPVWDALWDEYPHVLLEASGEAVGLPPGVMGNSEVGHLTIGSGRIIYQDLSLINRAVGDGSFYENPVLGAVMDKVVERDGSLHLMGLVSEGGVHSSIVHLKALVAMAKCRGIRRLFIHAFTDGRDTPPDSGVGYVEDVVRFLVQEGVGMVATVSGRYYAMDRDRRWDRLKLAYDALVHNEGLRAEDAVAAVRQSYERGETDEFIRPTIVGDGMESRIRSGDGLIFFNFRPDRARELSGALTQPSFAQFDRGEPLTGLAFACMTEYDPEMVLPVAFPKMEPKNVLAEVISKAGLSQLHIAETEKYAHVTFFFNGGREEPFSGERRILVPSPKDVATYDEKPEMSAYEVTERLEEAVRESPPDFCVLNFANPDMVGHTGNIEAAVEAVGHVDRCLGRAVQAFESIGAKILVTADHGNVESMLFCDGHECTAHSVNPVPLILLEKGSTLREGAGLSDIAPTVLCFLGLQAPPEMTGSSLCVDGS
jgi:2,3-bisphosphoglycerate-independent phosphoglycerate mutase